MQGFLCEGCGTAIAPTEVAVAVHLRLDWPRKPLPRTNSRGWVCASCMSGAPRRPVRTIAFDGIWSPHPTVDPPRPCEGCGRMVCLRTSPRRIRVACSHACGVRISAAHRPPTAPRDQTDSRGPGRL